MDPRYETVLTNLYTTITTLNTCTCIQLCITTMASVWSFESFDFQRSQRYHSDCLSSYKPEKKKKTLLRIKLQCWRHRVNSRYNGHHRDQHLMSVIKRVRNSRSCFQQFLFSWTSAFVRNNGVSEIARCPQGVCYRMPWLPFIFVLVLIPLCSRIRIICLD